jgi:hypothetical protein
MIMMLPNIYADPPDPDRVILIVAGTEIEGTAAAIMALCSGEIGNNTNKIPARVVRAVVEHREVKSPLGIMTKVTDVVGYEFLE